MTIEIGFVPEGRDDKIVLGEIAPGAFGSFSDYSAGIRKVISAYCSLDNSGGQVYIFDNEGFAENPAFRATPLHAYTKDNLDGEIKEGSTYERDITTETRKKGRLILSLIPD